MAAAAGLIASEFFEHVVNTVREPLLVLDADHVVRAANASFYRTFQVAPTDTLERTLPELGDGQWQIDALHILLTQLLPAGATVEDFEVTHVFPGVGERTMLLNARRINAPASQGMILLAIEDITARKRLETEREQLIAELTRSNQELERFAYVASHDLQEPLRMVSSYTDLLARKYGGHMDEKAETYIGYIVEGATRMRSLINALLAYSRVDRGGTADADVDLNEIAALAIHVQREAIAETRASVDCGALPVVGGDAVQLQQVFHNLLGNALKFRRPDSAPVIDIRAVERAGQVEISVTDNGIGIDPALVGKLFIIFQRLHTRAEFPGDGIGLALCRRIVERHGGRIWVDSTPGSGSSFHFTLPILPATRN